MIYLATPYSHDELAVKTHRYEEAVRHAAIYWKRGEMVFSPIAHTHPIAMHGIEGHWEIWKEFDHLMIDACDLVRVLKLPGWEESRGIAAEVAYAHDTETPVEYADVE